MSIDDSELREYTHGLFGSIAAALKQDFQPYLATCVSAALASCNQVSPIPYLLLHVLYLLLHIFTCFVTPAALPGQLTCCRCCVLHSIELSVKTFILGSRFQPRFMGNSTDPTPLVGCFELRGVNTAHSITWLH